MEELEMISNNLMIIPWTEPWNFDETRGPEIEALRIRPVKYLQDFCRRYVLRPQGPTKLLQNIIRFVFTDPKNQNFHLQSKRAYIYTYVEIGVGERNDEGEFDETKKELRWEHVTTKQFFDEFRKKMLVCYTKLVMAPHFHINGWATAELAQCKIPFTNQEMEKVLGELGPFPSWLEREKVRRK